MWINTNGWFCPTLSYNTVDQTNEQKEAASLRESMYAVTVFAQSYFSKMLTESEEGKNIGLSYFKEIAIFYQYYNVLFSSIFVAGYRGDAFRAPDPDPVRHDPRGAAGPRHLRLRGHGHGQDGGVHAASARALAVPTQGVGRHACARSRAH